MYICIRTFSELPYNPTWYVVQIVSFSRPSGFLDPLGKELGHDPSLTVCLYLEVQVSYDQAVTVLETPRSYSTYHIRILYNCRGPPSIRVQALLNTNRRGPEQAFARNLWGGPCAGLVREYMRVSKNLGPFLESNKDLSFRGSSKGVNESF